MASPIERLIFRPRIDNRNDYGTLKTGISKSADFERRRSYKTTKEDERGGKKKSGGGT